jgi:hypothetical protein
MSDRYGQIRRVPRDSEDHKIREASPAIALAQDMGVLPSENGPTRKGIDLAFELLSQLEDTGHAQRQTRALRNHPAPSRWDLDPELGAPPAADEWMACSVCRRTLESYRDADTGELFWDHTQMDIADGVNHRAVPISYQVLGIDNVRLRCDFCGEYDPGWDVPVADFAVRRFGQPWGSTSDWTACDTCADLISRDQWPELARRTTQATVRRAGITGRTKTQEVGKEILKLHREVRRHQQGPPEPVRVRITAFTAELDSAHRFSAFRRQP